MKKLFILLLLAAAALPLTVSAKNGEKNSWRKTDDHRVRKNSITATAGLWGISNYNSLGVGQLNLEYDRALPYNLSVSGVGLFAPCRGQTNSDTYTQEEIFYFAGAKVNYNLPVVRNWLYFRVGIGVGVGYHNILDRSMGMCYGGCDNPDPNNNPGPLPPIKDRVKAHFIADAYWVFRASKWLDLRFAPLILSPAQVIIGSKFNSPWDDKTFVWTSYFGTLGISVRF